MFITVNHNAFRVLQQFMAPSVDAAGYVTHSTDIVTLYFV
jgi:hypothetical protein